MTLFFLAYVQLAQGPEHGATEAQATARAQENDVPCPVPQTWGVVMCEEGVNGSFSIPHRLKATQSGLSIQEVLTENILWAPHCEQHFRAEMRSCPQGLTH